MKNGLVDLKPNLQKLFSNLQVLPNHLFSQKVLLPVVLSTIAPIARRMGIWLSSVGVG